MFGYSMDDIRISHATNVQLPPERSHLSIAKHIPEDVAENLRTLDIRQRLAERAAGGRDPLVAMMQDPQLNAMVRSGNIPEEVLRRMARVISQGGTPADLRQKMQSATSSLQSSDYFSHAELEGRMPVRSARIEALEASQPRIQRAYEEMARGLGKTPEEVRAVFRSPSDEQIDFAEKTLQGGLKGLLEAGPGTGKTETMAWTVAMAIARGLVRPQDLVITAATHASINAIFDRFFGTGSGGGSAPVSSILPKWNKDLARTTQFRTMHAQALSDLHTKREIGGVYTTPMEQLGYGGWELLGGGHPEQEHDLDALVSKGEQRQEEYLKRVMEAQGIRPRLSPKQYIQSIMETKTNQGNQAAYQERMERGRALFTKGEQAHPDAVFYLYEGNLHKLPGFQGAPDQTGPKYDLADAIHYWAQAGKQGMTAKKKGFVLDEMQDAMADMIRGIRANVRPEGMVLFGGDPGQRILSGVRRNERDVIPHPKMFPNIVRGSLTANYRSAPDIVAFVNALDMSRVTQESGTAPFQVAMKSDRGELAFTHMPNFHDLYTTELRDWFEKVGVTDEMFRSNVQEGRHPLAGATLAPASVPLVFQMKGRADAPGGRAHFLRVLEQKVAQILGPGGNVKEVLSQMLFPAEQAPRFGDPETAHLMHTVTVPQIKGFGTPHVFFDATLGGQWDQAGFERNRRIAASRAMESYSEYGSGQNFPGYQFNLAPEQHPYTQEPIPRGTAAVLPLMAENLHFFQGIPVEEMDEASRHFLNVGVPDVPSKEMEQMLDTPEVRAFLDRAVEVLSDIQPFYREPVGGTPLPVALKAGDEDKLDLGFNEEGRPGRESGFSIERNVTALLGSDRKGPDVTFLEHQRRILEHAAEGRELSGFSLLNVPGGATAFKKLMERVAQRPNVPKEEIFKKGEAPVPVFPDLEAGMGALQHVQPGGATAPLSRIPGVVEDMRPPSRRELPFRAEMEENPPPQRVDEDALDVKPFADMDVRTRLTEWERSVREQYVPQGSYGPQGLAFWHLGSMAVSEERRNAERLLTGEPHTQLAVFRQMNRQRYEDWRQLPGGLAAQTRDWERLVRTGLVPLGQMTDKKGKLIRPREGTPTYMDLAFQEAAARHFFGQPHALPTLLQMRANLDSRRFAGETLDAQDVRHLLHQALSTPAVAKHPAIEALLEAHMTDEKFLGAVAQRARNLGMGRFFQSGKEAVDAQRYVSSVLSGKIGWEQISPADREAIMARKAIVALKPLGLTTKKMEEGAARLFKNFLRRRAPLVGLAVGEARVKELFASEYEEDTPERDLQSYTLSMLRSQVSRQRLTPDLFQAFATATRDLAAQSLSEEERTGYQGFADLMKLHQEGFLTGEETYDKGLALTPAELEEITRRNPRHGELLRSILSKGEDQGLKTFQEAFQAIEQLPYYQAKLDLPGEARERLGVSLTESHIAPAVHKLRAFAHNLERYGVRDPEAYQGTVGLESYQKRLRDRLQGIGQHLPDDGTRDRVKAEMTAIERLRGKMSDERVQTQWGHTLNILLRATTGRGAFSYNVRGKEKSPINMLFDRMSLRNREVKPRTLGDVQELASALEEMTGHIQRTGSLKRAHVNRVLEAFRFQQGSDVWKRTFKRLTSLEEKGKFGDPQAELPLTEFRYDKGPVLPLYTYLDALAGEEGKGGEPNRMFHVLEELSRFPIDHTDPRAMFLGGHSGFPDILGTQKGTPLQTGMRGTLLPYDTRAPGAPKWLKKFRDDYLLSGTEFKQSSTVEEERGEEARGKKRFPYIPLYRFQPEGSNQSYVVRADQVAPIRHLPEDIRAQYLTPAGGGGLTPPPPPPAPPSLPEPEPEQGAPLASPPGEVMGAPLSVGPSRLPYLSPALKTGLPILFASGLQTDLLGQPLTGPMQGPRLEELRPPLGATQMAFSYPQYTSPRLSPRHTPVGPVLFSSGPQRDLLGNALQRGKEEEGSVPSSPPVQNDMQLPLAFPTRAPYTSPPLTHLSTLLPQYLARWHQQKTPPPSFPELPTRRDLHEQLLEARRTLSPAQFMQHLDDMEDVFFSGAVSPSQGPLSKEEKAFLDQNIGLQELVKEHRRSFIRSQALTGASPIARSVPLPPEEVPAPQIQSVTPAVTLPQPIPIGQRQLTPDEITRLQTIMAYRQKHGLSTKDLEALLTAGEASSPAPFSPPSAPEHLFTVLPDLPRRFELQEEIEHARSTLSPSAFQTYLNQAQIDFGEEMNRPLSHENPAARERALAHHFQAQRLQEVLRAAQPQPSSPPLSLEEMSVPLPPGIQHPQALPLIEDQAPPSAPVDINAWLGDDAGVMMGQAPSTLSPPPPPSPPLASPVPSPLLDDEEEQPPRLQTLQDIQAAILGGYPQMGLHKPSAAQRGVITAPSDRDLFVLGGPGGGKSETLAGRLGYEVGRGVVKPNQILPLSMIRSGVTAFNEMLEPYRKAFPKEAGFRLPRARSFHSFFWNIIAGRGTPWAREFDETTKKFHYPVLEDQGFNFSGRVLQSYFNIPREGLTPQERRKQEEESDLGFLSQVLRPYSDQRSMRRLNQDMLKNYLKFIGKTKANRLGIQGDEYDVAYQQGRQRAEDIESLLKQGQVSQVHKAMNKQLAFYLYEEGKRREGHLDFADYPHIVGRHLATHGFEAIPPQYQDIARFAIDEAQDVNPATMVAMAQVRNTHLAAGKDPRFLIGGDPMQALIPPGLGGIDPNQFEAIYEDLAGGPGSLMKHTLAENFRSDLGATLLNNAVLGHEALRGEAKSPLQKPTTTTLGHFPGLTLAQHDPHMMEQMLESMLATTGLTWDDLRANQAAGEGILKGYRPQTPPGQIPAIFTRHADRDLFFFTAKRRLQQELGVDAKRAGQIAQQIFRRDVPATAKGKEKTVGQFPVLLHAGSRSHGFLYPHQDVTQKGGGGIIEYLHRIFTGISRVKAGGQSHLFATPRPFTDEKLTSAYMSDPSQLTKQGGQYLLGAHPIQEDVQRNAMVQMGNMVVPEELEDIFRRHIADMLTQGISPQDMRGYLPSELHPVMEEIAKAQGMVPSVGTPPLSSSPSPFVSGAQAAPPPLFHIQKLVNGQWQTVPTGSNAPIGGTGGGTLSPPSNQSGQPSSPNPQGGPPPPPPPLHLQKWVNGQWQTVRPGKSTPPAGVRVVGSPPLPNQGGGQPSSPSGAQVPPPPPSPASSPVSSASSPPPPPLNRQQWVNGQWVPVPTPALVSANARGQAGQGGTPPPGTGTGAPISIPANNAQITITAGGTSTINVTPTGGSPAQPLSISQAPTMPLSGGRGQPPAGGGPPPAAPGQPPFGYYSGGVRATPATVPTQSQGSGGDQSLGFGYRNSFLQVGRSLARIGSELAMVGQTAEDTANKALREGGDYRHATLSILNTTPEGRTQIQDAGQIIRTSQGFVPGLLAATQNVPFLGSGPGGPALNTEDPNLIRAIGGIISSWFVMRTQQQQQQNVNRASAQDPGTAGFWDFSATGPDTITGLTDQYLAMYSKTQVASGIADYLGATNQSFTQPRAYTTALPMQIAALTGMDPAQVTAQMAAIATSVGAGRNRGGVAGPDFATSQLAGILQSTFQGNLRQQNVGPYLQAMESLVPDLSVFSNENIALSPSAGIGAAATGMPASSLQTPLSPITQAATIFKLALDAGIGPQNLPQVASMTSALATAGTSPDLSQQAFLAQQFGAQNLTAAPEYFSYLQGQHEQEFQLAGLRLQQQYNLPQLQIRAMNADITMQEANLSAQQFSLAQGQAQFQFTQYMQTQQLGPIGETMAQTGRAGYFDFMRRQMAAGFDPLNTDTASTFRPRGTPFGLQNEQFYAGVEHQRSMLVLGRSPLLADAAFNEQMKYLNQQENFYVRSLDLQNQQRQFERTWTQRALDQQARQLKAAEGSFAAQLAIEGYQKAQLELEGPHLKQMTNDLDRLLIEQRQQIAGQGPLRGGNIPPIQLIESLAQSYRTGGAGRDQALAQAAKQLHLSLADQGILTAIVQQAATMNIAQMEQFFATQQGAALLSEVATMIQQGAFAGQQQAAGTANTNLAQGGQGPAWQALLDAMNNSAKQSQAVASALSPTTAFVKYLGSISQALGPLAGAVGALESIIGTVAGIASGGGAGGAGGASGGGMGSFDGSGLSMPSGGMVPSDPNTDPKAGKLFSISDMEASPLLSKIYTESEKPRASQGVRFLAHLLNDIVQKRLGIDLSGLYGISAGTGTSLGTESHYGLLTPYVTKDFHARMNYGIHQGVDFAASQGTPLAEFVGGTVSAAGWKPWGGEVDVTVPGGLTERYLHLSQISVSPGQKVLKGQHLGLTGGGTPQSGLGYWSSGAHSHIQFDRGSYQGGINPWPIWTAFGEHDLRAYYGNNLNAVNLNSPNQNQALPPGAQMHHFAEGGIAMAPLRADLAEGGSPEAVIPLSKLRSVLATVEPQTPSSSLQKGGTTVTVQKLVDTLHLHVHTQSASMSEPERDQLMADTLDVLGAAITQLLGKIQ